MSKSSPVAREKRVISQDSREHPENSCFASPVVESTFRTIGSIFAKYKFTFQHKGSMTDFTDSRWPMRPTIYVCYRFVLSLCQTIWIGVQFYMVPKDHRWAWFIYIGNWNSVVMLAYFAFSFIVLFSLQCFSSPAIVPGEDPMEIYLKERETQQSLRSRTPGDSASGSVKSREIVLFTLPWYFKLQWFLFNCTCDISHLSNFATWLTVIGYGIEVTEFHIHFPVDAFIMTVDTWMVSMPIRFVHIWHGMQLAVIHAVFIVVYWLAGGTNEAGERYIYKSYDFENRPDLAVVMVVVTLAALIPCVHLFNVAMVAAREFVYRKCFLGI